MVIVFAVLVVVLETAMVVTMAVAMVVVVKVVVVGKVIVLVVALDGCRGRDAGRTVKPRSCESEGTECFFPKSEAFVIGEFARARFHCTNL